MDTGNAMDAVKEEIGKKIFFSNLEPIKHNEGWVSCKEVLYFSFVQIVPCEFGMSSMVGVLLRKERNGRRRKSKDSKWCLEEERVKLANDIYQTWVVNECFNALETLIYVFSGGLMMWQYPNPLFKIRGGDLKNSTL